ncbi:WD40/YVTN/BNR-like repeat-containing protein [Sunxiuqinia sp. A32]|uniref:WD40/YVTN/BNR-like repeat-containing protein n=1 Tax=Sunxiuqinia sp. A32 TaxID=3461496 RepID=UPI0040453E08
MRNLFIILLIVTAYSCSEQSKNKAETALKGTNKREAVLNLNLEEKAGIVYFSNDNGLSWQNKSAGLPDTVSVGLGGIAVSDNSLGIATKEAGVFLYDFENNRWVSVPTDKRIIDSDLGAMAFYHDQIFVGTRSGGVFSTDDKGKSWAQIAAGLSSLTIRRLFEIENSLYAGTNAGLYSYNENDKTWNLEYGNNALQVNGITAFDESIYIGTNQGVFTSPKDRNEWTQTLDNCSVHNISSGDQAIYAMIYNELLSSTDKGQNWQHIQKGLPSELYTFNVIENDHFVFAGQWDGVYRKDITADNWKSFSKGLPDKFAIANMKSYHGIIVVSTSKRELRKGMTTEKWSMGNFQ